MTVIKADLAQQLTDNLRFDGSTASDFVTAFFGEIGTALEAGEPVKLLGFGSFAILSKAARPGRNPATGVVIPVTARRVVTFYASAKLKLAVEARRSTPQSN